MIITVLYEDESAPNSNKFGPHTLLLKCIEDDVGKDDKEIGWHIISKPKKGNGNVKKELTSNYKKLSDAGGLCAVFDYDKVHECFSIGKNECKSSVQEKNRTATNCNNFTTIFLVENTETLLNACCEAVGIPHPLSKPNPEERDKICHKVAFSEKSIRDKVRELMPSFDYLVLKIKEKFMEKFADK